MLILAAVLILSDMRYESNDDFSISNQLSQGWYHVRFVNYYLCRAVGALYQLIPRINFFIVLQVILSFITLTILTCINFSVERVRLWHWAFLIVAGFVANDLYISVQFTKTAGFLLLSGFMMLFHGIVISRSVALRVTGSVWILIGSMLRFSNYRAMLGFAAAFTAAYLLWSFFGGRHDKAGARELLVRIGTLVLFLAVLSGAAAGVRALSTRKSTETEALRAYREYSKSRARVVDYPLPKYEDNKEAYDGQGITAVDLLLLRKRYFDTEGNASQENLKFITTLQDANSGTVPYPTALYKFAKFVHGYVLTAGGVFWHLLILVLASLIGFVFFERRWYVFPFILGAACFAAYLYLFHMGRIQYRAAFVIDAGGMFLLFYALRFAGIRESMRGAKLSVFLKRHTRLLSAALCLAVVLSVSYAALNHHRAVEKRSTYLGYAPDELFDYIHGSDKTFVIDSGTSINHYQYGLSYYNKPYLLQPALDNLFGFGGWSTMSPRLTALMEKRGLTNVFSDIIDNDNVYVVSSKYWVNKKGKSQIYPVYNTYFTRHYAAPGKVIRFVPCEKVGNYQLWQVRSFDKKEKK